MLCGADRSGPTQREGTNDYRAWKQAGTQASFRVADPIFTWNREPTETCEHSVKPFGGTGYYLSFTRQSQHSWPFLITIVTKAWCMQIKSMNVRDEEVKSGPENRRSFLSRSIYMLSSLIAGAFVWSVRDYLLGTPTAVDSGWADAGEIADLPKDSPQQISFTRNRVDGWKVRSEKSTAWVIVHRSGDVTAFSPLCTHLGCAYQWQSDKRKFNCPCHGSVFSESGDVVAGPAGRPLDRYPIKLEGNRLWLGPIDQSRNG